MKRSQVLETYDASYAAEYNDTFLLDGWTRASVAFQLDLLRGLLQGARRWLDVACGTGFVLSQFPGIERTGLDLSPAMLDAARRRNPDVTFVERDFRDPYPGWNGSFDVVSCMWWAYCLGESMSEVDQVAARLADWVTPDGTCVVPLCNPQKFDPHNIRIPYIDARVPGRCMITGITWTWIQENGKRHDEVVSPLPAHAAAIFERYFDRVEIVEGPIDRIGYGWRVQDVLLARRRKAVRPSADLFPPVDGVPAGQREWLFGTASGTLAGLTYPSRDLRRVRICIDRRTSEEPWSVQAQKIGYPIAEGARYRLEFSARADAARPLSVGVSGADGGAEGLGLYERVNVTTAWTPFAMEFAATAATPRARVHFDVGQSDVPIELGDVALRQLPDQR